MAARWLFSIILILVQALVPLTFAQSSSQGVSATAKVPANSSYFQQNLDSDATGAVAQYTTITYTITYGSTLGYAAPITLQGSWSRGTIAGDPTPSVDTLDYVIGSATQAYNNTSAVVDTVNRKITWNIASLPANTTNQTVTFQLKTTDAYTGAQDVSFQVFSDMTGDGISVPQVHVDQTYQFNPAITPTPSPTPTATPIPSPTITPTPRQTATPAPIPGSSTTNNEPTATPVSNPTLTPTPTPAKQNELSFSSIRIETISGTEASISIETSLPTTTAVLYGTTPTNLSQQILVNKFSTFKTITIPNLSLKTPYYFQIIAKDGSGKLVTSDIFTFTTASTTEAPLVQLGTILFTADNKVMTINPVNDEKHAKAPTLVLPVATVYEIQFAFDPNHPVKSVQILTRNKKILADVSNPLQKAFAEKLGNDMVEIRPGVFITKLTTPKTTGTYEVFARINDYNGTISEQKVGELIVSRKFTVVDDHDYPIENARVFFYVYKEKLHSYIVTNDYPAANPSYTDAYGELNISLPPGRYKVHVSVLGFEQKDVEFTLANRAVDSYPKISLKKQPFNFFTTINYLQDAIADLWGNTFSDLQTIAVSSRAFNVTAVFLLWLFILITFLIFSFKTSTPPFVSIAQISYILHRIFSPHKTDAYVHGVVRDKKTNALLARTQVFLIENKTQRVLSQTSTNAKGVFLTKRLTTPFHFMIVKKGFEPMVVYPDTPEVVQISLHATSKDTTIQSKLSRTVNRTLSMFFETLIVSSLVMEFLLTQVFGVERTWPFITLSLINVFLWFYFLSIKHHKEI